MGRGRAPAVEVPAGPGRVPVSQEHARGAPHPEGSDAGLMGRGPPGPSVGRAALGRPGEDRVWSAVSSALGAQDQGRPPPRAPRGGREGPILPPRLERGAGSQECSVSVLLGWSAALSPGNAFDPEVPGTRGGTGLPRRRPGAGPTLLEPPGPQVELAGVRRGGFARELGSPGLWAETGGLGALQALSSPTGDCRCCSFAPWGLGAPLL